MKRLNNLYQQICSIENLQSADVKARKGKAGNYGIHIHDRNRQRNIETLRQMLLNRTYKTSDYSTFKVYEPKEREVFRLPYYPDRITHHAVMNVLEPVFTSVFTADTYSCIKGKGIHGAVRNMKEVLKDVRGTQYCLKLDIKKFYPNIDHDVLKQLLRRKFKDNDLLWLLDEIIDSAPGVPIGNYLSQYFANFYLSYFDHWIKEVKLVKYYFRYADDLVILAATKQELHKLLADINEYLTANLKLTIKENYQVFPVSSRGIDFVGYVFFHTHVLLRKTIKKNYARKLAANPKASTVASYHGWLKHCNSINLQKKLLHNHEKFQRIGHHMLRTKVHWRQGQNDQGTKQANSGSRLQNRRLSVQESIPDTADKHRRKQTRRVYQFKVAHGNDKAGTQRCLPF
jgi:RNA-directed DNA polymerase